MRTPILFMLAVLTARSADARCPEPRPTPDPFFSLSRAEMGKKFSTLPAAEQVDIALLDMKLHEKPLGFPSQLLVERKDKVVAAAHERALCGATSDLERLELVLMIGAAADFFPEACSAGTVNQLKTIVSATRSAKWREEMARYTSESYCQPIQQAFRPRKPAAGCASPADHERAGAQANNVHMLLALYLATAGRAATPVIGDDCRITWRGPMLPPAGR